MAGIHEIVRETPKPKRPAPKPGELLAQLRSVVARFEQIAHANAQRVAVIERRLLELNATFGESR
jgi:hypothetical protein